jgi:hypothetical protein
MKHHVRLLVLLSCVLAAPLFIACGSDGKEKNPSTEPLPRFALNSLSVNGDSITFTWTDPAVSGFDHVDITYSGTKVSVGRGSQMRVISGLSSESLYTITAAFVDAEGNRSQAVVFSARTESSGSASVDFTRIDTASKLDDVRNDLSGNYLLVADLDLSGFSSWTPIGNGSANFSGIFNGNGHTIANLTITSSDEYQGLFGFTSGGIINDLRLDGVTVSGSNDVGGLVGCSENSSVISHCRVTGSVSGSESRIGGLVGYSGGNGSIISCTASGTVSGDSDVGGLLGYNSGSVVTKSFATCDVISASGFVGGLVGYNFSGSTISNCYSTGTVTATSTGFLGGLAGFNNSDIINCYATGTVTGSNNYRGGLTGTDFGTVTASFYDSVTTGMSDADKGLPKTTSEMKTKATFTDVGWDFAGETTNGSADLWDIESTINEGYPYLKGLADLY